MARVEQRRMALAGEAQRAGDRDIGMADPIAAPPRLIDKPLPVQAYGEVWQRGRFTCRSEQSGMTCFNAMQHGFSLSRAEQTVL
jgi:hypothetical protein